MKKPRKQLLLLAALLVLILTGIPDYRSGTDGRFSS